MDRKTLDHHAATLVTLAETLDSIASALDAAPRADWLDDAAIRVRLAWAHATTAARTLRDRATPVTHLEG